MFFVKIFLKPLLSKSANKPWRCLKYSLKILKTITKIVASKPPKIKKEKGIKEMAQINSLKPKVIPKETIKICFRLFKPNNSPARRLTKNPLQNIKNKNKSKTIKPMIKLMVWAKIKNQIILAARNTKIGDTNKKIFGEIFIPLEIYLRFS